MRRPAGPWPPQCRVAWLLAPRGVPMRPAALPWMAPSVRGAPALSRRRARPELDVLDAGAGARRRRCARPGTAARLWTPVPSWSADYRQRQPRGGGRSCEREGVAQLDGLVVSHADGRFITVDARFGGLVPASRAWLLSPLSPDDPLCITRWTLRAAAIAGQALDLGRRRLPGPASRRGCPSGRSAGRRRARKENDRGCVMRVATAGGAASSRPTSRRSASRRWSRRDANALRSDVARRAAPWLEDFLHRRLPHRCRGDRASRLLSLGYRNRFRHPHGDRGGRYAGAPRIARCIAPISPAQLCTWCAGCAAARRASASRAFRGRCDTGANAVRTPEGANEETEASRTGAACFLVARRETSTGYAPLFPRRSLRRRYARPPRAYDREGAFIRERFPRTVDADLHARRAPVRASRAAPCSR
jgi:hypothetical protein